MQVRVIALSDGCPGGNCPTTYSHPQRQDMALVQGEAISDPELLAELNIPAGETVVAVPNSLLANHVREAQA